MIIFFSNSNRTCFYYIFSFILFIGFGCKSKSPLPTVDITDLYHSSQGKGDPIIVIHGGPGLGCSYLEDHLTDILTKDHQVIYYDQRNSGRSPFTQDTSKVNMATFIKDIDDVRQYYKLDKVTLLAHSWGGLLAMQYAIEYPDYLDRLILINSNAADSDLNNKANKRLANRMSADDINARTQIMKTQAFINKKARAYEELMLIGFGYQFSNRNMINQLTLNLSEDFSAKSILLSNLAKDFTTYNFTSDLARIKAPTLLLYGIEDPLTSFALNSLSQAIPNSTIKAIDDAGHFPFIEKNKESLDIMIDFLR